MPTTSVELPILTQFLCVVRSRMSDDSPAQMADSKISEQRKATSEDSIASQSLPKGVVLGKDGKPCRSCTSVASWMSMARNQKTPTTAPSSTSDNASSSLSNTSTYSPSTMTDLSTATDCPPDVDTLGRSTWTLLHALTATYPEKPTTAEQTQAKTFISLFSSLYPCSHCAGDFQEWMKERGNEPRLSSQEEFGRWMCDAHNAVNVKLGKQKFDCDFWKERWRDGWKDGRCG